MEHKALIEYARKVVSEKPELKAEINDLIQLCNDEIEEGGSPTHERNLCYESIKQLAEGK
jgi:hypothetical protein